eukprot:gene28308-31526_t
MSSRQSAGSRRAVRRFARSHPRSGQHRTGSSTRISTIDVRLPPVPQFRHHVEAIALKAVVGLLRPLPVDAASWLMGKLWRHVLPLGRRNQRTLRNLEYALPELSAEERLKIAAGVRENLGRVFIEAFRLPEFSLDPSRFDLTGASLLADIAQGNGNAVIASLHMGNWEACSGAARRSSSVIFTLPPVVMFTTASQFCLMRGRNWANTAGSGVGRPSFGSRAWRCRIAAPASAAAIDCSAISSGVIGR